MISPVHNKSKSSLIILFRVNYKLEKKIFERVPAINLFNKEHKSRTCYKGWNTFIKRKDIEIDISS